MTTKIDPVQLYAVCVFPYLNSGYRDKFSGVQNLYGFLKNFCVELVAK